MLGVGVWGHWLMCLCPMITKTRYLRTAPSTSVSSAVSCPVFFPLTPLPQALCLNPPSHHTPVVSSPTLSWDLLWAHVVEVGGVRWVTDYEIWGQHAVGQYISTCVIEMTWFWLWDSNNIRRLDSMVLIVGKPMPHGNPEKTFSLNYQDWGS